MCAAIRIGNAQGFWGDSPDAPRSLLEQAPDLDFLTLDYLAEVSMSILAAQRKKDSTAGFARDFLEVVEALVPLWKQGLRTRLICNAGGLNPTGCGKAVRERLDAAGLHDRVVAVVYGDDVLDVLRADPDHPNFAHLESGASLTQIVERLYTANAYIGADAVARALDLGADIVVTGRVADPSLTVGACIHAFQWRLDDYDRLAAATVAGHVIECGTQACGGISTDWLNLPSPEALGFPIAEVSDDGTVYITKPADSGGTVSRATVTEQLLYEIGDPTNYISPDCCVDFTSLRLEETEKDRVRITHVRGAAPPNTYKVSATYQDGYWASGTLTIFGRHAVEKAKRCGNIILERLRRVGFTYARTQVECLGANACAGGILPAPDLLETVLRVSVADPNRDAVDRFTKEIAPLVTSGPQGTTGYAAGRPKVHPVFAFWPCRIERHRVFPTAVRIETTS